MNENILDDKPDRHTDYHALRRNLLPVWYKILHWLLLCIGLNGLVAMGVPAILYLTNWMNEGTFHTWFFITQMWPLVLEMGMIASAIAILYGTPWALKMCIGTSLYFLLFFTAITIVNGHLDVTFSRLAFPIGIDLYVLYTYFRLRKAWADPEFFESPL